MYACMSESECGVYICSVCLCCACMFRYMCPYTLCARPEDDIVALLCHKLKPGRQMVSPSVLSVGSPHIIQVTGMHTAFPAGAGIWARVGRLCSKRALNHWACHLSPALSFWDQISLCILAWPWVCDHPASTSKNWDYKHMPLHPASSQYGGLWSKNVPHLSRDLHFSHSSVLDLNHAHIVWVCYN